MPHAPHNPRTGKLSLVAAALALACLHAAAQTAPKPSPAQPAAPRNTSVPASSSQIQPTPAPTPNWPANQAPEPAQIKWDSQGLHISAANSSLRQILTEIATRTGAKLEGVSSDERVFGEYGPGQARDVLAQLLHGSSYNVLLIGDQGQGTPRQIILSRRSSTPSAQQPGANPASQDNEDDSDTSSPVSEEPPPPPQAPQQPAQPPQQPGATGPGPRMITPSQPNQPQQQQQPQ